MIDPPVLLNAHMVILRRFGLFYAHLAIAEGFLSPNTRIAGYLFSQLRKSRTIFFAVRELPDGFYSNWHVSDAIRVYKAYKVHDVYKVYNRHYIGYFCLYMSKLDNILPIEMMILMVCKD